MKICDFSVCTACEACINICPNRCISLKENELGYLKYHIDEKRCVSCGICGKVCPNNHPAVLHEPFVCYASWAKNADERSTSSSGGVASTFYRHMISGGGSIVGAGLINGEFTLFLSESAQNISLFKGSKYVHCHTGTVFQKVKENLQSSKSVLFVGTPCQIGGLKNYLGKDEPLLITVDLVCHGTPPARYLKEHLGDCFCDMKTCSFRPNGEYALTYSLKKAECASKVYTLNAGCDTYFLPFLQGIICADNCYTCVYARQERVSDLTIGDYWGIGKEVPFGYTKEKVSLVLVNTHRGLEFLQSVDGLQLVERPIQEAVNGNAQLCHPSIAPNDRNKFINNYAKYGYEGAIKHLSIIRSIYKNRFMQYLSQYHK